MKKLTDYIVRRHTDQKLMQYTRKDEYDRARHVGAPTPSYERRVDVPPHKVVDWFVPRSPIHPDTGAVPPVRVEFPISEPCDLRQCVQERLEKREEASEPDDH